MSKSPSSSLGVCGWQKMTLVGFSVRFCKKNCGFWFSFTKVTAVLVFLFGFFALRVVLRVCTLLADLENPTLWCWIGPTNCQPKWLRTRSAEIRHEEKYFDCWSYHAARWIANGTMWKTVPKPPKSVFWKLNCRNRVFSFLNFEVGSVFKPKTDIWHFHWVPHTPNHRHHGT